MSRSKPLPRMLASAFALAALTLLPVGLVAQSTTAAATAVAVQANAAATTQVARIAGPVDDTVRIPLKGNVHPLAKARYDQGAAPASMPSGRLSLLLAPSAQQHEALREYLDSLQNPASPNYHKWLTPATYGASYGASEQDIATITAWLTSHGFKIEKIATARNLIQFSGSIAQVTAAFHTPIHSFLVNGEHHFSNTVDPQIPAALAPVVAAISPLNDFHPRSGARIAGRETWDAATKRYVPQLTLPVDNSGDVALFVDPADAAVIYNTPNSALNTNHSGTTYNGTGVTIGIAGDSDISVQDVANYRSLFLNDTNTAHLPNTIIDGSDPGIVPGDALEALLDTELAGGIAPGATVNLYTAANTDLQAGLFLAIGRAVQDNVASILNVSFGECEQGLGSNANAFFSAIWEEAAAQGITVTVSTGDSGSAGCDDPNADSPIASNGLAVNGIASTPYNVAVGGTDFLLTSANFGTYVQDSSTGTAPYYGTALSYIPEAPWNDSIETLDGPISSNVAYIYQGVGSIAAGSGGVSGEYAKPAFQSALTPTDGARDLPDVSLLAGNGAYGALWALCADNVAAGSTSTFTDCTGPITYDGLQAGGISGVGGTSAAAPAFAGMLALVSQSLSGARLGQANTSLYKLASSLYSTVFHDVTQGNNSVPCVQGSPNCAADSESQYFLTGYNAGTGYDLASGLGSVNASEMVSNWTSAGLTTSTVALTANGGTTPLNITHGQSVNFTVTATPSGATGDVSINDTSNVANNGTILATTTPPPSLSGGTVSFSANTLPGGSYNVYAYYGGDTNYAGAASNSIPVTVSKENSTTTLTINVINPAANSSYSSTSFPFGFYAYADAQSYGNASTNPANGLVDGYPTGTVTFAGITSSPQVSFNSVGYAEDPIYDLGPGSYTVTAQYSGDVSLNPSSSTPATFAITQAPTSLQATPALTTLSSTASTTISVLLSSDSVSDTFPTGPLTITVNGVTGTQTGTPVYVNPSGEDGLSATFTVQGSSLVAGANTITITYGGDGNYSGTSTTTSITLSTTPSFSLGGPSGGITVTAPGQTGTGTVTITPVNGFSGAVALTCSVAFTGSGTAPTCSLNPGSVTVSGAPATTALTVGTTAATAAVSYPLGRFFAAGGGVALGCMLLLGMPARRRGWRQMLLPLALVLLTGAGLLGLAGCGGSSNSGGGGGGGTGGTPAGSYVVTVTGTQGSVVQSTTVTVVVQ